MTTTTTTMIAVSVVLRASLVASFVLLPLVSTVTGGALSIPNDIAATFPWASQSLQGSDKELVMGMTMIWDSKDQNEAVPIVFDCIAEGLCNGPGFWHIPLVWILLLSPPCM